MTKGFLTIAAVLALVLLFAAAAVPEEITIPETEPITAPEPTVSAQIPTARYRLTADERELICEVVMAESGIEPFDGKMAVSQCILNACEKTGKRPAEIVEEYGYTDRRVEPNADLRGANLDYSCYPLWCGSLHLKADKRLACQLAYHLCSMQCDDADYIKMRNSILGFANQFHRVDECGELKEREV